MMRTFVALFVAVLIAAYTGPLFAQQQQPVQPQEPGQPGAPTAPPGPRRIIPGRTLAGIEVGRPVGRVLARFGRPSEVRETALDTVYVFNRFGINVYAKGGVVTAASGTNSLLKIDENLGVGHRVEDATAMFGRGFREGTVEGWPGLIYDGRGIAFGLDGRGVAAVVVFRPGTAANVSGLLPGGAGAAPVAGFPNVAHLRPFSPETNFMSLPGYLRWLMHEASGTWITYQEAERVVKEQQAGTTR